MFSVFAGNVFPSSFEDIVKKIHRYLYHVIAHIYQSHYKEILCLKLHPHLNTVFQHFMTFNREFKLLDEKESESLEDLFIKLEGVSVGFNPDGETDDKSDCKKDEGNEKDNTDAKEENKENENREQTPNENSSTVNTSTANSSS